jgi:hypothetical protein
MVISRGSNPELVTGSIVAKLSARNRHLLRSFAVCATVVLLGSTFVAVFVSVPMEPRADTFGSSDVFPSYGFGGYVVQGTVRHIQASWRIPTIAPTSPSGIAATWIGAQDKSGKGFIQIGVNEYAQQKGEDFYEAFWSDTAVKFHPQPLGALSSGETVQASMKRDRSGWQISLRDPSGNFSVSRHISFGVGIDYTSAQWLQEDPTSGLVVAQDVPYPVMANVRFTNLLVNGVKPRLRIRDAQVLITSSGEIEIPTPVSDNSFTFTSPHGPQRQYLDDARRADYGDSTFQVEFTHWTSLSASQKHRYAQHLIDTLVLLSKELETQSWPQPARKPISQLLLVTREQIADLQTWSAGGLARKGRGYVKFEATEKAHQRTANRVRASLNLPPVQ